MRLLTLPKALYRGLYASYRSASPLAQERARIVKLVNEKRQRGLSATDACFLAGVPVSTYYRWWKLLRSDGVKGLERRVVKSRSRLAPKQRLVAVEVERLRKTYNWGKEKLTPLLHANGYQVSESTVGRVISKGIARGYLKPCGVPSSTSKRRQAAQRAHARRKRYGERALEPGQLVQIDTLHESTDGMQRRQFTAICPVSKFVIADVYSRATARNARAFLDLLVATAPFQISSIQVDNGAEFRGEFEERCQELGIELVTIKPRSPKQNAVVERMQRTFRDEFYAYYQPTDPLPTVREHLRNYLSTYNTIRPHKSLNNLTPTQYLEHWSPHLSQKT